VYPGTYRSRRGLTPAATSLTWGNSGGSVGERTQTLDIQDHNPVLYATTWPSADVTASQWPCNGQYGRV
jgi:hypothetical protein